tara:strand:+ start:111 stop:437 length:327 start_codon:yes stop_codon:yes gene_type:complete
MKITKTQLKQIIKEEIENCNLFEVKLQKESEVDRLLTYIHKHFRTTIDHPLEQAELIYKLVDKYYASIPGPEQSAILSLARDLKHQTDDAAMQDFELEEEPEAESQEQ